MAEETQVTLSPATLEFCRDALARQIQATYDEPAICDSGVAHEVEFLRTCARELGVDFDKVVREETTVLERQRLESALAEEAAGGDPYGIKRAGLQRGLVDRSKME